MATYPQSVTYTRTFVLVQSLDHIAGLTGATPTVRLTKAGVGTSIAGGVVSEVDAAFAPGLYKIALTTTDTNTIGDLAFAITATNADPNNFVDQIVTATPSFPTNFSSLAIDGTGRVTVGSNADKSGYSLAQAFPTNFASLAIDASGRMDLGKVLGTASAGAAGYMGLDWAAIRAATSTVNLSGTTISTTQAVASVSGTVAANATQWGGAAVGSVVPGSEFTRAGTAQGGGASTITLDAGAPSVNNLYQNRWCRSCREPARGSRR